MSNNNSRNWNTTGKIPEGYRFPFNPSLMVWTIASRLCKTDLDFSKYFGVKEKQITDFVENERHKERYNKNYISNYLKARVEERNKLRTKIHEAFEKTVEQGDSRSIIFGMKSINGLMEEKDKKMLELKRAEFMLRSNQFLYSLAMEFKLDKKELQDFANNYFEKPPINEDYYK